MREMTMFPNGVMMMRSKYVVIPVDIIPQSMTGEKFLNNSLFDSVETANSI
jgi:hypothetical protein